MHTSFSGRLQAAVRNWCKESLETPVWHSIEWTRKINGDFQISARQCGHHFWACARSHLSTPHLPFSSPACLTSPAFPVSAYFFIPTLCLLRGLIPWRWIWHATRNGIRNRRASWYLSSMASNFRRKTCLAPPSLQWHLLSGNASFYSTWHWESAKRQSRLSSHVVVAQT